MLESAVAYCLVAGFAVRAGNVDDELVIIVPQARATSHDGGTRFEVGAQS